MTSLFYMKEKFYSHFLSAGGGDDWTRLPEVVRPQSENRKLAARVRRVALAAPSAGWRFCCLLFATRVGGAERGSRPRPALTDRRRLQTTIKVAAFAEAAHRRLVQRPHPGSTRVFLCYRVSKFLLFTSSVRWYLSPTVMDWVRVVMPGRGCYRTQNQTCCCFQLSPFRARRKELEKHLSW